MIRTLGGRIVTTAAGIILVVGGVVVYLLFLPDLKGPVLDERVRAGLAPAPPYDYRGVLHLHTDASHDGIGTWPDLRSAARRHRIDFVLVTDHNTRAWADRGLEGWKDGLLLIVGEERGTPQGHLLVVGTGRPAGPPLMIVAHPTNPKFPWRGAIPAGALVEIWSGDTAWRIHGRLAIAARVLAGCLDLPRALASLASRPAPDLALWDGAGVPGVAGNDSHGGLPLLRDREGRPSWRLRWPSYDAALGFGLTHVLLPGPLSGNAGPDRDAVLRALAAGRAYIANEGLYPVTGFRFTASSATMSRRGWVTLRASVPVAPSADGLSGRVETALFRDGREICRTARPTMTVRVREPGSYRIEVTYGASRRPWIFSNPIRIYWS